MKFTPSAIREGRKLKREARDAGLDIRGRTSELFTEEMVPELQDLVEKTITENREWLAVEWKKVTALLRGTTPSSFDDVVPVFQKTLEKRVKLYSKARNATMRELVSSIDLIETLFEQASFEFIMSFRISAQEGETYGNALKIASLSHWLNPRDIKRLNEKYNGQVDASVIKSAALSYPKNPDAFIDSYVQEIVRLNEKYNGQVDASVIKSAALSYPKNPDAFIDWFKKTEGELLLISEPRPPKKSVVHEVMLRNHFKSAEELSKMV